MVKIYVGNVSKSARRDDLYDLFAKYGKVVECDILRDFGFVHMDDNRAAEQAVKELNGLLFCGMNLRVEISIGPAKKDSRGPPSRDRDDHSRSDRRDRSPLRGREDVYRDRDYDYGRSSGNPISSGSSSSFYAMLASAAANVHHDLVRLGIRDPQEIYGRMYYAISQAASAPPPPPISGGGYERDSGYSGSRYNDSYGGSYGGHGGSSSGRGADPYDRRRF